MENELDVRRKSADPSMSCLQAVQGGPESRAAGPVGPDPEDVGSGSGGGSSSGAGGDGGEGDPPARTVATGRVKWFDAAKGFGFVAPDADGPDILLHANVLRGFGQGSVAEGAPITMVVAATARGLQAVEVLAVAPPEDAGPPEPAAAPDLGPLEPARVRWFDRGKGFGFANAFGSDRDVFVHLDVLRRAGLADLQPGEAIAMRVAEGRRGLIATHVAPWDAAVEARR